MALSDLAVYSEYVYTSMTEVLRQQVNLFNGATNGAITLSQAAHQGDFSDKTMWAAVSGLVRRRNAYGSGAVTPKNLAMLVDTMVKVATGTPPVNIDPGMFKWIQKNPEEAGVVLGQQIAVQQMADMLDIALGAFYASHAQVTSMKLDISGNTAPADLLTFGTTTQAAAAYGDGAGGNIVVWVGHSKVWYDIYQNNLVNNAQLFTFDTINVTRDPFGRVLVMTDSPSLVVAGSPNKYITLGLKQGAVNVEVNNDFTDNYEMSNGNENITRTYQAEWSYELGVKGFAWDKVNGGKSPNNSALLLGTNWDRYATSAKDLGGVVIVSH